MRARTTLPLLCATLLLAVCADAASHQTIIRNFNPNRDGSNPTGGLLADEAGNLFGATLGGTIFEFTPNGAGGWTYHILYQCLSADCSFPQGFLVKDAAGNLYGSTYFGDVFEYSPDGSGGWTAKMIYAFSGNAGSGPSPLILDSAGNLFGIFGEGGSHNRGFVFELPRLPGEHGP